MAQGNPWLIAAPRDTFQKYVEGRLAAQKDLARKMSDLFLDFADSNYLGDKS